MQLAKCRGFQHLVGKQFLQLRVLVLQRLQPPGVGQVHPAVLSLPIIKGRLGNAVFAAKIRNLRDRLLLAQNPDDLLFRKPLPLHPSVLQPRPDSNPNQRKLPGAGQNQETGPSAARAAICDGGHAASGTADVPIAASRRPILII
jgi:hypothetical protein